MPFKSDAQRKGFYSKSATHQEFTPSTQTQQPQTSKFHLIQRLKQHSAKRRAENEERDQSKRQLIAEKEKKNEEIRGKIREQIKNIQTERQVLEDLQKGKVTPEDLKKLTEEDKKEILPKGTLEKREEEKKRYEALARGKGESFAFPSGYQHKRKITVVDPTTGKKETMYTSRLPDKEAMAQNPLTFAGFEEGKPVFTEPPKELPTTTAIPRSTNIIGGTTSIPLPKEIKTDDDLPYARLDPKLSKGFDES